MFEPPVERIVVIPVPFGSNARSTLVSPDAPIIGAVDVAATAEPPVAAFVISISFTALAVV